MRIFTNASGMGGGNDELLLARVKERVAQLDPAKLDPGMKVGYGGDIANAQAEKESLIHEARIGTLVAAILILGGIVWFYGFPPRSCSSASRRSSRGARLRVRVRHMEVPAS